MTSAVAMRGVTATLCRDPRQFAGLAAQWEALRRRSRSATPFQSHAWLYSWWLSYGAPGRLRIVLVRKGGELVAAAPLMLVRRPVPTLVTLGGGISDFGDVLLDDGCPQAATALAKALHRAARGAVIDLREVRPGAAAEQLHAAWRGPRRVLQDSVCLELPAVSMDALLAQLPTASAKRTRRKLRKIDAMGIQEETVPSERVAEAVRTMLRLHELQWEGRGVTPEHLKPRFRTHLERAMREMADNGDAVITEYRLGDDVVASDVTLSSPDLVCGYLYGAHPWLRAERVDITTMLLRHDAEYAAGSGHKVLNMLRGAEPHKLRWQPTPVVNQRFLLARRELTPALGLHSAWIAGRAFAAEMVRACTAVPWPWRHRGNGHGANGAAG